MNIFSRIISSGSYLPKKILTNKDLEKLVDTSDHWIVERTGIKERHLVDHEETCAMMGHAAAEQALRDANINAESLDMILVATTTADYYFPSTACLIQKKLGIKNIPALDINAACAGFNYGLSIADQYIRAGTYKTILIIGVEIMSRLIDWHDRSTCVLFGDGAGCVILRADNKPGIHSTHIHANGHYGDLLYATNPIAHRSPHPTSVKMRGSEVFKIAVQTLAAALDETLQSQKNPEDRVVDWMVPHQANLRIIQAAANRINLPLEKVIITVEKHGNTSSASIPLAFDTAVRDGRIQRGQRILLESFGAGFTWGTALVTY